MSKTVAQTRVFKILSPEAWATAERVGAVAVDGDDARDGFVHLSTGPQLAGTLSQHFSGAERLTLVGFEANAFGPALRWEASRGGALFPHLYGALRADAAVAVWPLARGADGAFVLPPEIA